MLLSKHHPTYLSTKMLVLHSPPLFVSLRCFDPTTGLAPPRWIAGDSSCFITAVLILPPSPLTSRLQPSFLSHAQFTRALRQTSHTWCSVSNAKPETVCRLTTYLCLPYVFLVSFRTLCRLFRDLDVLFLLFRVVFG